MNHFYQNIPHFFNYEHLYLRMIKKYPVNSHFVEVGAWYGGSAAFMGVEIANSNSQIKFDVVDTWKGSVEHSNNEDVINDTLYEKFLSYTQPVKNYINPIRLPSLEAAKLYPDNSLDFVFIDAAHDFENVLADIYAWYPKVKNTGTLAGHDYNHGGGIGVANAVEKLFGKQGTKFDVEGSCWFTDKQHHGLITI